MNGSTALHSRRVALGDVALEIAEAGPGGQPVLLVHGFTGAKEDFTQWLGPLASHGWHAVAPDLRGHGASDKPEGAGAYSFATLAADLAALADALGWDRYVLLGHSMGGFVAQRVAVADPGRLRGLVLMDTSHRAMASLDDDQLSLASEIALGAGMDKLADVMADNESPIETAAHRRLVAERPGYAEFGDRKLRASSPWMFATLLPELAHAPDILGALGTMDPVPPTLVIVGEQDQPFLEPCRAMADAIAGAELAVIADAGHSPQFENPDAWWKALTTFLARVS